MTTLSSRLAATAFASLFLMGSAFAQTPAPSTAPAASAPPAATTTTAKKPRSADSQECYDEANAKGLHGKERKKFHRDCVRAKKTNADDAAKSAK